MPTKTLLTALVWLGATSGALAARVPSAVYNGLNYGYHRTHAGAAVRAARPGSYHRTDNERRRRRHDRGDDSGS